MTVSVIRILVEDYFISKYRLSKEIGVSWATISRWYRGKFSPNLEHQKKLENFYEKIASGKH